jgi:hypothetical protein
MRAPARRSCRVMGTEKVSHLEEVQNLEVSEKVSENFSADLLFVLTS